MRTPLVLLAAVAVLACIPAKASPSPYSEWAASVGTANAPPPSVVVEAPRKAFSPAGALHAVQKAAPVVMAVAGEALASAPAVAVAGATGGPFAAVLAFIANNPTLVGLALGLVVMLVVHVLRMRGVLTPERAAAITAVTVPIAQSPEVRAFVAKSDTKLDNLGLDVLDKLNAELKKIGATKPAEIAFAKALVEKHATKTEA